jgi:peptidoglycan/xylan/chitin deacetylase (PgdA/CDA1 family)
VPEVDAQLYASNTPDRFWRLLTDPSPTPAEWAAAVGAAAAAELPPEVRRGGDQIEALLYHSLGEGQFGPARWRLSPARRAYYLVKPWLPRQLRTGLRRLHRGRAHRDFPLRWPAETRFAAFLYRVAGQVALGRGLRHLPYVGFWPDAHLFSLVLTHDIESAAGQDFALEVAGREERLGFRSAFNFVAEDYRVDRGLIQELRSRGHEVGLHGCHHDGRLFSSRRRFHSRARRINRHLRELGTGGFRSPLTHRRADWMQELEIAYDLSFFDTDPYEPMPGGVMTLWPFRIGRFLELPYTLAQDHTLFAILGERTPRLWLDKVAVVRSLGGMALVNAHPDYLRDPRLLAIYETLLGALREDPACWRALPGEVAAWWQARTEAAVPLQVPGARRALLEVDGAGGARLLEGGESFDHAV